MELVLKNMPVKSAIAVMMNTITILFAILVNAQATPKMLLMFVIKENSMAPARVQRVTLVDNVMYVKLSTLVTQSAQVCSH